MLIVRAVKESDVDALFDLVQQAELGLTTLKISKERLQERVEQSIFAFQQKKARPAGQPYVFVMEDLTNGRLVGTSAIYSKVGGFEPFYTYEIEQSIHESKELGVYKVIETLHLREIHDGPTEIGSLFLSPEYWGRGYGRLLSMARFMFIACFPERFEKEVIAEMRGVVHPDGRSPLWSALGAHFFQIEFPKAETLSNESKKFIADLMPEHPIYIPLLPREAQEVIGKVHPNTEPALAILRREGFEFRNLVDIFDGGPAMHAETANIRVVKESQVLTIREIREEIADTELMISNTSLDFRCGLGKLRRLDGQSCAIDQVTALQLGLRLGETLRAAPLRPGGAEGHSDTAEWVG